MIHIIATIGKFGVGKMYLLNKLIETYPDTFKMLTPVRTREPRIIDGKQEEGIFVTKEEFRKMLEKKEIIAESFIERSQQYYGNLLSEIQEDTKKVYVLEADPCRVRNMLDNPALKNCIIHKILIDADINTRIERFREREKDTFTKEKEDELQNRILLGDSDFERCIDKYNIINYSVYNNEKNSNIEDFFKLANDLIKKSI